MKNDLYEIRDTCRGNLSMYTRKAFYMLPVVHKPNILDAGCGTGVPTLELAKISNGMIYAVDSDSESCEILRGKVNESGHEGRIKVINSSLLSADLPDSFFDIVWAEGLLNVIGFEEGLRCLGRFMKKNGYLVIHDETSNGEWKKGIIGSLQYCLLDSFRLDEDVWLDGYCRCMEKKIEKCLSGPEGALHSRKSMEDELRDIEAWKKNPVNLRSIFYILKRGDAA